jgi:hypothetical protein
MAFSTRQRLRPAHELARLSGKNIAQEQQFLANNQDSRCVG